VIRLKPGVCLDMLTPQMVIAATIIDQVYAYYAVDECWITSANDSKHSKKSFHYFGKALDIRTHNIKDSKLKTAIMEKIKLFLGEEFDVILESKGTSNEHIHVEWDPK